MKIKMSAASLLGLVIGLLMGMLTIGAPAPASAAPTAAGTSTTAPDTDCTWLWNRTIPRSHQEYKYKKTIPAVAGVKEYKYRKPVKDYKTQHWAKYQKHVKGIVQKKSGSSWVNYSTFDWEKWQRPTWNTDGTFKIRDWADTASPDVIEEGGHGDTSATYTSGSYTLRKVSQKYSYRVIERKTQQVETGSHWEYTDWTTDTLGSPWVKVDERWKVAPVPAQTVYYNDGNWTTDAPGSPWVKYDERTVQDAPIIQGPVRSANEPDRGNYPNVPWIKDGSGKICKATPVAFSSTPGDCFSDGSAKVPSQPVGVIVKVNGNVVSTPWSTSTPGTYDVVYSAAPNYTLTNNPSGSVVVTGKTPYENCIATSRSGSVDCGGYVVNGSNGDSAKLPVTFDIVRPDGSVEQVVVQPGESFTRTYPVIEDATSTVTISAPGVDDLVLRFAADCQANEAVATAPSSDDKCEPLSGPTRDRFTVPNDAEFQYTNNGGIVAPGTYPAVNKLIVLKAVPKPGFIPEPGSQTTWKLGFTKVDCFKPVKVRGAATSLDKCRTAGDRFAVRSEKGVVYKVNGKSVREGRWLKTNGARKIVVKATAASERFNLVGKTRFVLKFTNKPCGTPDVPPDTGAKPVV